MSISSADLRSQEIKKPLPENIHFRIAARGFVSTVPFTSVQFSEGTAFPGIQPNVVETYDLENLEYAAVPEPGILIYSAYP